MQQKENSSIWMNYTIRILILGVIPIMLFIWFHYRPWKIYHNDHLLETIGIETIATVLDKYSTNGGKGTTYYSLILEYIPEESINKEPLKIDLNVSGYSYGFTRVDDNQVPILYLVDQPNVIKLKGEEPESQPLLECILFDLMILVFILHRIFVYFRDKRQRD